MSLVSLMAELESHDEEMSKEAQEHMKLEAEEDAAGRIMARGFMDELDKLAAGYTPGSSLPPAPKKGTYVNPGKDAGTVAGQKRMKGGFQPPKPPKPSM